MGISVRGSVPRKVTYAVFAAMLFGGATAACGKHTGSTLTAEDSPRKPAAAVAKAAENAEDIASLRYRISGILPKRGRITAEASMTTKPLAMSMTMQADSRRTDRRLEIRFVGRVIYVGGSAVAPEKLGGKSWFSADSAVWGRSMLDNNTYGVLPLQFEGSPVLQSTILTGSKDVRSIGDETVNGTRTTHYRGTVTGDGLRAARDAATDKAAQQRRLESLDQFGALGTDPLTMDLWIDGDNRTRQFRVRGESYGMESNPLDKILDLTVTFLEINQPVTIETPPANDTADIEALADGTETG